MAMKPKTLNEMIQCTIVMYILINFLMRTSQELGMYSLMRLKWPGGVFIKRGSRYLTRRLLFLICSDQIYFEKILL